MDSGVRDNRLDPLPDLAADEVAQIDTAAEEHCRQDGEGDKRSQPFFGHSQKEFNIPLTGDSSQRGSG